jgi:polyketide cyclase/dehydrase/lipid transport protein
VSVVRRSIALPSPPAAAEALWYDADRWGSWVDGFATLVQRRGAWPDVGGSIVWVSTPHGRGRVTERVREYEPGAGQTIAFEDDRLSGEQSVCFVAIDSGVEVTLSVDYSIKGAGFGGAVVDILFIRRAVRDSLDRTLGAFGRGLGSPHPPRL